MICVLLVLLWHNNIIMLNSTIKGRPLPQVTFHTDYGRNCVPKHVVYVMTK